MDEVPPTVEPTQSDEEGPSEGGQPQDSESTTGNAVCVIPNSVHLTINNTCTCTLESSVPDPNSTNTSDAKAGKKDEKASPTSRTVKVNLTAEFTTLDLLPPSSADLDLSIAK